MKKLIMAIAVAGVAAISQAGTVSWTMTGVYAGNDKDFNTGTAYLFAYTGDGTGQYTEANVGKAIQDAFVKGYGDTAAGIDAVNAFLDAKSNYSWNPAAADGKYSIGSGLLENADVKMAGGTTYNAFAVIFNEASTAFDADAKFFISNTKSVTTKGDAATQNSPISFLGQTGSKTAANWTAVSNVPEPTSGLLLLLGMAGLALRRRQVA